jgi:hypothetical protein
MMSYEFWVKQLLDVMELIADRNYQVRRWLAPDSHAWEHPGSLMVDIFDAFTFDLFIEMYSACMNSSQLTACERLKREADHWCDTTPTWPDKRETIDSPDWIKVREAAAAFIRAFTPTQPA